LNIRYSGMSLSDDWQLPTFQDKLSAPSSTGWQVVSKRRYLPNNVALHYWRATISFIPRWNPPVTYI